MKSIEELSVYQAEKQIMEYLDPLYPKLPKKPILLSRTPTQDNIEKYTKGVEQYELELNEYRIKNSVFKEESARLYSLLVEKVKEDSGLNDIPEQYRDKVYSYAYEQGHGSGYSEVYHYLHNLVEIFK